MDSLNIVDEAPPMDRVVTGARALQRVAQLIERLPLKCRRVFILRRIHGVSQRDIARMFGITQNAVEKQAARGLKLIVEALEGDELVEDSEGENRERSRDRTRER
jgi:RNA polymerase sigma factor (sigma-70 family)